MDTFIEKIVRKQKDAFDFLKIFGIFVGGVFLILASFFILQQSFVCIIVILLVGYGGWFLITSINEEFEYILTNNFLDVDKIIAQRKRKRVLSVDIKSFDFFGKLTDERIAKYCNSNFKNIYASSNRKNDDLYFAVYNDKEKGKAVLFFEPDERMIEIIKKYIPQKVEL